MTDLKNSIPRIAIPMPHSGDSDYAERAFPQYENAVRRTGGAPIRIDLHQSGSVEGDGLRVVARSPVDNVVEAVEGTSPEHFVLAVQWHPERSVNDGPEVAESALAIFLAFIEAAREKH